ncbi:MAG: acyl-CoA dehydrogenase family protein [Deltaproteobacteria bacterium]|nr:acyl-CoA dehydrogenase family protein [Deltaproteobacteria bacterium]
MDLFFDPEQLLLRGQVRSWVEKNLISSVTREADIGQQARQLVSQLGHEGFTAYVASKRFGGVKEKVQARDLCIIREELARGSALADTMFAMQALGSYPITVAGSDKQKKRYLPPVARGEAIAAFALTEPQAGSDVSSMETRAVRDGDGYRLTGIKRFISNAGIAQTYTVFALTDPDKRAKGMSAFVVQADTPGFVFKENTPLLSPHPLGVIAFEDCRVPRAQLLGKEGEGLKIALATLDTLRCTVAAAAVGFAQRALEEALQYSQKRRQFGQALAQFQATQFKLADMATELEASRLLAYQAAWANDHNQKDLKQKSSMAKLFATEAAQRIVDQALQIHGGTGVVVGTPVEQLYRDVRALRIYEGTSEIQRLVIARSLL